MSDLTRDPGLPVANPTKSYWQDPPHEGLRSIQSQTLPPARDIVVLGSGITGFSAVLALLKADPTSSITVLDARDVCSSATGRNGGRINCVAVLDYDKYRRRFGHDAAAAIVRFELAHLEAIRAVAGEFGVLGESEIRDVETVAAAFSDRKAQELKGLLGLFEEAFPDLRGRWWICEGEKLSTKYHLPTAKAALIGRAGCAWPYRMITAIFAKLLQDHSSRFAIETNTPAASIRRDSAAADYPYVISTPRGQIRAKHILHCTEGHAAHLIPGLRGVLVPRRGQISVQRPGSRFPYRNGDRSWSFYFHSGFDYASQMPGSGDIVIGSGDLGGIDAIDEVYGISADDTESISANAHLSGILPVVFGDKNWGPEAVGQPHLKTSWVGVLCNSLDSVPMVGRLPREALIDRGDGSQAAAEWISAGYGGYGMVNAFLCGKALAGMVKGQEVDEALPEQYLVSAERIRRLQDRVKRIVRSEGHFRAFL
ncbi:FAD dependent oxidoreductase [Aspergillus californicus]